MAVAEFLVSDCFVPEAVHVGQVTMFLYTSSKTNVTLLKFFASILMEERYSLKSEP